MKTLPLVAAAATTLALLSSPTASATLPTDTSYGPLPAGVPAGVPAAVPAPPRGEAPRIPFRRATDVTFGAGTWKLVRPDGTVQRTGRATWGDFAVLGRSVVGTFGSENGVVLDVVGPGGRVERRSGLEHYGLGLSPDRSIVGYLDDAERPVALEAGATRTLRLARVSGARRLGALLGSGTCQEQAPEGGGCTAFVDVRRGVRYTTSHGITDTVPGLLQVADVNARGRVAGVVSRGPTCSGVLDDVGADPAWTTCDHTLRAFAPGGRQVLGERVDRAGDLTQTAIYGRGGALLASWSWQASGLRATDVTWEDPQHLLAVVHLGNAWWIYRLGVDGSTERAAGPLRVGPDYAPYQLPLR